MSCTGKLYLILFLLSTHAARAQYVVSTRAGTINYVRGQASVDGQPLNAMPLKFPMLKEGQVLRTGNGRAEVLLGPGVFLRLGEHGALRMLDTRLENAEVEVQQGTSLVEVVEMPHASDVHVVSGPTRTGFKGMGLHRFEADSHELRVFGGHAEVIAGDQKAEAGRGRLVHLWRRRPFPFQKVRPGIVGRMRSTNGPPADRISSSVRICKPARVKRIGKSL